jgi:hypothetical protein
MQRRHPIFRKIPDSMFSTGKDFGRIESVPCSRFPAAAHRQKRPGPARGGRHTIFRATCPLQRCHEQVHKRYAHQPEQGVRERAALAEHSLDARSTPFVRTFSDSAFTTCTEGGGVRFSCRVSTRSCETCSITRPFRMAPAVSETLNFPVTETGRNGHIRPGWNLAPNQQSRARADRLRTALSTLVSCRAISNHRENAA